MHNQHISGTLQDVPTNSAVEKFFFSVPELHRINTQRNQMCCDLSSRCACAGLGSYQGLLEKNFTINEKTSNSKLFDGVSFLGYSISKEGIAPDLKHVGKIKNAKSPTNNN